MIALPPTNPDAAEADRWHENIRRSAQTTAAVFERANGVAQATFERAKKGGHPASFTRRPSIPLHRTTCAVRGNVNTPVSREWAGRP